MAASRLLSDTVVVSCVNVRSALLEGFVFPTVETSALLVSFMTLRLDAVALSHSVYEWYLHKQPISTGAWFHFRNQKNQEPSLFAYSAGNIFLLRCNVKQADKSVRGKQTVMSEKHFVFMLRSMQLC